MIKFIDEGYISSTYLDYEQNAKIMYTAYGWRYEGDIKKYQKHGKGV